MGPDSYLLSMAQSLHHMMSFLRYTLLANGLYPSYQLSGLCYDRFFYYASFPQATFPRLTFSLISPRRSLLQPEGVFIAFVPLSPQTSTSTDWFSCANYVVPLTHRFYRLPSRSMMTRPSD